MVYFGHLRYSHLHDSYDSGQSFPRENHAIYTNLGVIECRARDASSASRELHLLVEPALARLTNWTGLIAIDRHNIRR